MAKLILEAGRTEKHYWADLWRYRELFGILAWRDIAVRYKQTAVGAAWAIIQPLATMVVMTVVFGKIAGLPSEGHAPYAVMIFAAMLPWQFFSNALSAAGQSVVGNANLISKVYFPRLIIPASAAGVACVDFLVSFLIMGGMMAWYEFVPNGRVLWLPVLIAISFLAALGPGLIITALNVRYRDFRYVIPFIVQFGLYVSPVAYSSTVIRDKFGEGVFLIYSLNPIVGIIDGFRWAILGDGVEMDYGGLGISICMGIALLFLGVWYFRKTEKSFADII